MTRRKSPRERRLAADFDAVLQLQQESTIFSFESGGSPPNRYRFKFKGAGFCRDSRDRIQVCHEHEILVELGAAYPRMIPNLAWQTPIFHPNISNNGVVCLGSYGTHWVPSLTLDEMCTMLWDMIRYKNLDTESPYNREAALWAKHQTDFEFPIDARSIRDRVRQQSLKSIQQPDQQASQKGGPTSVIDAVIVEQQEVAPPPIIIGSNDIEIIESGIEIVDSNVRVPASDGILFLD